MNARITIQAEAERSTHRAITKPCCLEQFSMKNEMTVFLISVAIILRCNSIYAVTKCVDLTNGGTSFKQTSLATRFNEWISLDGDMWAKYRIIGPLRLLYMGIGIGSDDGSKDSPLGFIRHVHNVVTTTLQLNDVTFLQIAKVWITQKTLLDLN